MKNMLVSMMILVAVIQLAVPASMIQGRERTLREGDVFKFRTAAVDPYDAFRGRYVVLRVNSETVPLEGEMPPQRRRRTVFAALQTGDDGFAFVSRAYRTAPRAGAYVRAKAYARNENQVEVWLPIERFYLPEHEAPAAERAVAQAARGANGEAVIVVRVRNGDLVVEDLLIGGQPIRAWMAEQSAHTEK